MARRSRVTKTIGYGKAFASFGEIVQGRLADGEDFLVTLPVDMWSTCEIIRDGCAGESSIDCEFAKSKEVVRRVLGELGLTTGEKLTIRFTRTIPIGKGLSSSTADMLAVVRALQELYGVIVSEGFLSRLFASIEPHDALHYYMSVVYNHRSGSLLQKLHYIPDYTIVAVDKGGVVDSCRYNLHLSFTEDELRFYRDLLGRLLSAFSSRSEKAIAECATESAQQHVVRTGDALLQRVLDYATRVDALGVVATHSGTCAGLLFPGEMAPDDCDAVARQVEGDLRCGTFTTRTLKILL